MSECLKSGNISVDCKDDNGNTALWYACHSGHIQVVELLLTHIIDMNTLPPVPDEEINENITNTNIIATLNVRNKEGKTVLMAAAIAGRKEVCELLLTRGCDINVQNNNGATAMLIAASAGHHDVVELFLTHGCKKHIVDNDRNNALIHSCKNGHIEVSKLLLTHGIKINIKNKNGYTALIYAASIGATELIELLFAHSFEQDIQVLDMIETKTKDGNNALMYAAEGGHLPVIKLLVSNKCNIFTHNDRGVTALMKAVEHGYHDVCDYFLTYNHYNRMTSEESIAKINYINKQNNLFKTALIIGAEKGRKEVIPILLSHSCDVHLHDVENNTGTHFAYSLTHSCLLTHTYYSVILGPS